MASNSQTAPKGVPVAPAVAAAPKAQAVPVSPAPVSPAPVTPLSNVSNSVSTTSAPSSPSANEDPIAVLQNIFHSVVQSELLIALIVWAVVCTVLILIGCCIVCFVCRRRKKEKSLKAPPGEPSTLKKDNYPDLYENDSREDNGGWRWRGPPPLPPNDPFHIPRVSVGSDDRMLLEQQAYARATMEPFFLPVGPRPSPRLTGTLPAPSKLHPHYPSRHAQLRYDSTPSLHDEDLAPPRPHSIAIAGSANSATLKAAGDAGRGKSEQIGLDNWTTREIVRRESRKRQRNKNQQKSVPATPDINNVYDNLDSNDSDPSEQSVTEMMSFSRPKNRKSPRHTEDDFPDVRI